MDDAERASGEAMLRSTPWVRELLAPVGLLDCAPPVFDAMFARDAALREKHYVIGSRAPFIFKGPRLDVDDPSGRFQYNEGTRTRDTAAAAAGGIRSSLGNRAIMTWAVYAGHYAINGAYNLQGGAIAAIFDYATACAGSTVFSRGDFVLTKSNAVKYLRTAGPVPGVFKVVVELKDFDLEQGTMLLHSTLTRDDIKPGERPFATAVTEMVDGPRRKAWKAAKKKTAISVAATSAAAAPAETGATSACERNSSL